MERNALVEPRPPRGPGRRRVRWALGTLGALVAVLLVGTALRADPVGYGTVFWPVATARDQEEGRAVAQITGVVRAEAEARGSLAEVPDAVRELGYAVTAVRVDRPTSAEGSLLMRVRVPVGGGSGREPAEVRCREVAVSGNSALVVSSRRIDC